MTRSIFLCAFVFHLTFFYQSTSGQVNCVAVGNDLISGLKNSIAYTSDGKVWNAVTDRIFSQQGTGIYYSPEQNLWVATGSGTNTLAYSNNGTKWFGNGVKIFSSVGQTVHYSEEQDLWVAGGQGVNSIAYSLNGKNWTGIGSTIFTKMTGVVYSDTLNKWIGVGTGTYNKFAYSLNGKNWTGLGFVLFSTNGNSVAFANNIFVVTGVGSSHSQGWSTDGSSWTGTGHISGTSSNNQAYGQSKWLIIGDNTFANSTDGKVWYPQPTTYFPFANGKAVRYSLNLALWIAVGQSTSTAWSPNGTIWIAGTNIFSANGNDVACTYNSTLTTTTTTPTTTTPTTTTTSTTDEVTTTSTTEFTSTTEESTTTTEAPTTTEETTVETETEGPNELKRVISKRNQPINNSNGTSVLIVSGICLSLIFIFSIFRYRG